jgi:hypothetical protein
MGLEHGHGSAQLVRRIRDEPPLGLKGDLEAVERAIDRADERMHGLDAGLGTFRHSKKRLFYFILTSYLTRTNAPWHRFSLLARGR